jgi:F-type H+-transporting ATPase subunit delta
MSVETVARRYAGALADIVAKSGEAAKIQTELKQWEEILTSNQNLFEALSNPAIAYNNKERVLESLLAKTKPAPTTANFLRILLQNGRLTELSHINKKFASVLEERAGIVSGKVISARPLSAQEKKEIQTNLEKTLAKTVSLDFDIDTDIIGGVVTKIGSTVYDGSVKTQLENLKAQLINA